MFDLDREIAAWTESVYAERCDPTASAAELRDHVYCEVEHGRAAGLTDEQAFRAATARLGTASELAAEQKKNRPVAAVACAVAGRVERGTDPADRRLLIVHGFVWAVLMVVSAVYLKHSTALVAQWLPIAISLWLASEILFRRALRLRRTGRENHS